MFKVGDLVIRVYLTTGTFRNNYGPHRVDDVTTTGDIKITSVDPNCYWDKENFKLYKPETKEKTTQITKGAEMLKCIIKNFPKTEDAILVEKYLNGVTTDLVKDTVFVSVNKDAILKECKKREEEAKAVKS